MSWVSNANIKTIMQSIRNKFTTGDLVVANDAKSIGAEFNYGGQDGLLSVSPLGTGASTEAALHLCNGDDTKKTELTQGTLSYVQGSGDSETYNYLSLLGDGVATFGKNGGGYIQIKGVDDPYQNHDAVNLNYLNERFAVGNVYLENLADVTIPAKSFQSVYLSNINTTPTYTYPISAYLSGNTITSKKGYVLHAFVTVCGPIADSNKAYTVWVYNPSDVEQTISLNGQHVYIVYSRFLDIVEY